MRRKGARWRGFVRPHRAEMSVEEERRRYGTLGPAGPVRHIDLKEYQGVTRGQTKVTPRSRTS